MNYIKTNKLDFTSHPGQQQQRIELHIKVLFNFVSFNFLSWGKNLFVVENV